MRRSGARLVRVGREREEAAVRALAPLQVRVHADEHLRDLVRVRGADPRTEGGRGRHGRARELDADRALARNWVISRRVIRIWCIVRINAQALKETSDGLTSEVGDPVRMAKCGVNIRLRPGEPFVFTCHLKG